MSRSPTTVCSVARLYWQCSVGAITAYCSLAASPLAVERTKLYAARFGPVETSYQVMNQKPGTLIGMVSDCQMPPLRHAGSFGERSIIAPPVVLGILSEKMPLGPSIFEMMSFSGRCSNAFAQSTGGICGARSNIFEVLMRSAWDVFFGNMGRT